MKQFVILFLLFTISPISFTFAQNKIFCEIIEQIVSQKKTRIYLDYGQERNKKKDIRLENENEKAEIFYSRVEALNIMSTLGWKFEQAYVKVSGSSGNGYGST
jgi:C4-dicarboxylate transporter